jgi:hypothetical protein
LKVRLKGLSQAKKALADFKQLAGQAVARAVYVAGNVVMTEAKTRAPIDTGVLRASGYVTIPSATNPKVEIGFGGAAEPYALVQHERTEFRHEVGEAKFLQNAIDATDIRGIVEGQVNDAVKAGGAPLVPGPHRTEPE